MVVYICVGFAFLLHVVLFHIISLHIILLHISLFHILLLQVLVPFYMWLLLHVIVFLVLLFRIVCGVSCCLWGLFHVVCGVGVLLLFCFNVCVFFCVVFFPFQKLAAHLDKEREKMNEFRKMMGLPLEGDE